MKMSLYFTDTTNPIPNPDGRIFLGVFRSKVLAYLYVAHYCKDFPKGYFTISNDDLELYDTFTLKEISNI